MAMAPMTFSRRNSSMAFLRNLMILGGGGFFLGILMFFLGLRFGGHELWGKLSRILVLETQEPEVDLETLLVQRIRSASELTTAISVLDTIVPASQRVTMGNFTLGETKLLYVAAGEVRAGIDLQDFSGDNVAIADGEVTIQLPPPKILDSKIDVNRSYIYDYDRGPLGLGPDVGPDLQITAQRQTLTVMVEKACRSNLLEQANHQAQSSLESLLTAIAQQPIRVETTPATAEDCEDYLALNP